MNNLLYEIIHIVPSNANMGPVNVAKDLVYGLNRIKMKSSLFCLRDKKRNGLVLNFLKLFNILKTKKIKVLHSHGIMPDIVCFILSFIFTFKWISTVHADPEEDLKFIYPKGYVLICFIWRNLLKKADEVVYLTEFIYSKQKIKNKKFIPNCRLIKNIDNTNYTPPISRRKLGFCGVLIERKNIRNLILATLYNPKYSLSIAGNGPLQKELKNIARLNKNIVFLGHQDNLDDFWSEIDILVLPSFAEGVPLVAIEAIARGIPLILIKLDNYKNIFTDRESFFISSLNNDSLYNAVEHIYSNYDSYHKGAISTYVKKFNFDDWIIKYKSLYSI